MTLSRRLNCQWFLAVSLLAFPALAASLAGQTPPPAGTITLAVDATEATRKLLHARLLIPITTPGTMLLRYPRWIPGEHAPTGPLNNLVNLRFSAGGRPVPWRRDPVDLDTFRVDVPPGAGTLEVSLDYVVVPGENGFSGSTSISAQLAMIHWSQLLLYPAGVPTDALTYQAFLKLPPGWKFGTALPAADMQGETAGFQPVSLTTLVDSPVIAGAFYRQIPLAENAPSNVMDVVADSAAVLALPDEEVARYRKLVAEAGALFGATHYTNYHFLCTLSDHTFHSGIEHHESSLDAMPERAFVDKDTRDNWASLLPHEFVHSWNGKFRRPAGLATPDFHEPMRDDLLWVYEGLTEYLGTLVLTARAGLQDPELVRDGLASMAAMLDARSGRAWRPLQDTADAASLLYESPGAWADLRRRVDFYPEGTLLWLEADARLRAATKGAKTLDDFCRAFHGGQSGPPAVKPYTFEDVVRTLDAVAPGTTDWRAFWTERLNSVAPHAPLEGLEASGWRLVFNDQPNRADKIKDAEEKLLDLRYSLGLVLKEDGTVVDVRGNSPAFTAGLAPGMKVVAVDGRALAPKVLKDALAAGKNAGAPTTELLVNHEEFYRTFRVDYHGGERYPHLERDAARPDGLGAILRPLTK